MSAIRKFILPTTLKRWDIQNLDYNWYFALTIIGGFVGLDYLYLGSPLGAFTKAIFNLFTFGFWWYYDALNAAVSQDQVRLYGPSAPMVGLTGLAAGRFRDIKNPVGLETQLNKHMNFLLYGIVLVSLGIIGGDSFLTGNFFNGVMRLFSLISMIGAPVAIFWWISNLYYYFLDTGSCIDQNWNYFGAPKPENEGDECPSVLMIFTVWILKTLLALLELIPFFGPVASIVQMLVKKLEIAYGFVKKGVEELKDAKDRAGDLLAAEKARPLPKVIDLQVGMQPLPTPESCKLDAADLKKGTPAEVAAAAKEQAGGGELLIAENPFFGLLFLGAIGFVIVSSIVLSLRRSRQNAATAEQQSKAAQQPGDQETDVPPEPRNARVPPAVY